MLASTPVAWRPCPPPWYLTLQGLSVAWAFRNVVVSGRSYFYVTDDFQLAGSKSCSASGELCPALAPHRFPHILLLRSFSLSATRDRFQDVKK